ncbi:MAG: NAD-dependent dihydropyrimidine dehydrogenase subunit PreA, partial [Oscillospiraceae bacterium]|nr:NAD-dependent dihydropyrimidine dehydrogenase subunit PreA [Oscillospiraceae bacterium]
MAVTTDSKTNAALELTCAINHVAHCLLCYDAPCTAACPREQDPARMIRALRFENLSGASVFTQSCIGCDAPCENACLAPEHAVPIKNLSNFANKQKGFEPQNLSLQTEFCGIQCENPFFLSSSIVSSNYEMCARALQAGWAGVVFKTIGMIQPKEVSPRFDAIRKEGTPFIGFRNLEQISDHPLEENLSFLHDLKRDF